MLLKPFLLKDENGSAQLRRLPQFDGISFRIVQASEAPVRIRLRVYLHLDSCCLQLRHHLRRVPVLQHAVRAHVLVNFAKMRFQLWRTASAVQILVPETNLPLQLFLRAVGYKATRVVRECFDSEDAYLMERQH